MSVHSPCQCLVDHGNTKIIQHALEVSVFNMFKLDKMWINMNYEDETLKEEDEIIPIVLLSNTL